MKQPAPSRRAQTTDNASGRNRGPNRSLNPRSLIRAILLIICVLCAAWAIRGLYLNNMQHAEPADTDTLQFPLR
ncbi:hypothetical protein [Rurimicrobium arvi]|uniref:hypothetical protein n=1 Tax=Rurimicrobium arvi TaxID=2049916 RepID=UPI0031D44F2A